MLLRAFLLSAAAMSLVAVAVPAAAQEAQIVVTGKKIPPGYESVSRTVSIADLDLTTTQGVLKMEKRVAHGIAVVCPLPAGNSPQYEVHDYDACRKFAMDGARPQMDRAIAAAKTAQQSRMK